MLGEEVEVKKDATYCKIDAKQATIKQPGLFFSPYIQNAKTDDEEEEQ